MRKQLIILLFFIGISGAFSQNKSLGVTTSFMFGDFFYPVIGNYSPGFELGVNFRKDNCWGQKKVGFHTELTYLFRQSNTGEMSQLLPKLGMSYKMVSGKCTFEPIVGLYSKVLLSYQSFYKYGGNKIDSKRITLGAFVKPQVNFQISNKVIVSFFASMRFDITPTYYIWYSTYFAERKYSLSSGVQLLFSLNSSN